MTNNPKPFPCAGCDHHQYCADETMTCLMFRRYCNYDPICSAQRKPDKPWVESFCRSASFSAAKPQDEVQTEKIYQHKIKMIREHLDADHEVKVSILNNAWRKGYRDRAKEIISRVRRDLADCTVVTQESKFSIKGQIRPMMLSPTI